MKPIRIAQFGLGPIGLATLRLLAEKPWAKVVGGIDINPQVVGKSIDRVAGTDAFGSAWVHDSFEALASVAKPDVVLHTAGSSAIASIEQIIPMVEMGVHVASTCEPLLYPWLTEPHAADQLDAIAKLRKVSIVGTGVNPGFAMDLLPVVFTGISRRVDRIEVRRVVDAVHRRGPLQKKIGSGMDPAVFKQLFAERKAGHVGFRESAALIAHCMGWAVKPENIVESLEPLIADHPIVTEHVNVQPGQVRGLHQWVTVTDGGRSGREVVHLDLRMALEEPNPQDSARIEGDPDLSLVVPGGIHGDHATVASLVNVVPRLVKSLPGLRLITDLASPLHNIPLDRELVPVVPASLTAANA